MIYIVVTEAYYGGEDIVRVFSDAGAAMNYRITVGAEYDTATLSLAREYEYNAGYVVLTEEFYGGEDSVRVFPSQEEAEAYADTLDLDTVIVYREVV